MNLPEIRAPKVTLINFTNRPMETLTWANKIYKGFSYKNLDEMSAAMAAKGERYEDFLAPFLKDPTNTALEYIQLVFLIENVSRAFQQQLTRHRMASYIIHSLRVFDVGRFAEEGRYTMPSTVKNRQAYHEEMLDIQGAYNNAVHNKENIEDARGLLPLNLHSTISMRVDFGALRHICRGRLCLTAQEEARKVGYQFKAAVSEGMGAWFGDLLQPPCHKIYGGVCTNTPNFCGVPLYLASEDPARFKAWYEENGGRPDGSRIPTNSTILPEDLEQVKIALEAGARK